jgi:hypothetical protein
MFIFIVFYHRYHLAARTVLQKRDTLVYKIYIFVLCTCSGYEVTKELELYFADGKTVHYCPFSSIRVLFCRERSILFFSFFHCDSADILGRLFIPESIYKNYA